MRLIASTVVRESIRGKQRTGYIYDVDWEARRVNRRLPVPDPRYPASDDNPRGGVRGGRGVAVTRAGIVVANYDTLLRYDDDFALTEEFSHPLFVGTHEIDWDGQHLWTTSTAIDAVLKVGLDGGVEVAWDPHASRSARLLGLRKRAHPIDGSIDYRIRQAPLVDNCHINSIRRYEGFAVVNCGLVRKHRPRLLRKLERLRRRVRTASESGHGQHARRHAARSLVVRVDDDGTTRVLLEFPDVDFPTHNGQLLDDGRVVINDSTRNTVRVFDAEGGETNRIRVPGTWLRGLARFDGSKLFVGTAPAGVVLLDLERNAVEDQLVLSEDPNEAVHGLTPCPPPAERR